MSPEDLGAAREERHLVDSLWQTYFNEPSSLQEKGLLVLPGEDAPAPAPDVASKHFESPLRAWAANPSADRTTQTETKATPLLLGLGTAPSAADVQGSSGATENGTNTSGREQ
uniref:Uncharacterized protein n=2 Tax=Cannabis sativa TaxID=3483 RepID=A0A803R8X4_CANSA